MPGATIRNDEATNQDRLSRAQYAEALAGLAEKCETPLVIGLYGGWGVGKTSLMKLIEDNLDTERTHAVWFDPWRHQFDDSPALALLHTVVDQLQMQEDGKKLLLVIAGAFSSMLLKATTTLGVDDIDALGKRFEEERFQLREMRVRLQQHFRELIEKAQGPEKRRIVFFIDDLDRCMPPQILNLLESLKLYLNLPGCVYFLGVDHHALQRSIEYQYKDLELSETCYLDKIVQLPFTIPPIAPESMEEFVAPLLSEALQPCQTVLVKGLGDNPREIKRFVNTLILNNQLASGLNIPGYDPTALAMLLLIQYRSPSLFRLLARQPAILRRVQEGTEDTKVVRDEFFTRDEGLQDALASVAIPEDTRLKQYIYLTQVAGVKDVEAGEPQEEGRRATVKIDLGNLLAAHRQWVESECQRGQRADLRGADLRGAELAGVQLHRVRLASANLHRANLQKADLGWADLRWTDLSGADLQQANLTGAQLSGAKLNEAHLVGARLEAANLRAASLTGAILHDVELKGASLQKANLALAEGLVPNQLASAVTDDTTILPNGSRGPFRAGSGAHQPPS